MVEIQGVVDQIVYKNDDNGYVVLKLKTKDDLIAAVGYVPFITEGQRIKIEGEWVIHPTFGQQVKIKSCEEILPSNIEGIERYLSSGLIPGIGPVTAKNIVKKFGEDSLDIIEMNPGKLKEVDGIGEKKAFAISEAFKEQRELKNVMVFLQTYGVSTAYGIKIFKKYGQNTINTVRENPYKLCEDISGIGFKTADRIARNLGMPLNSIERAKAGIKYILYSFTANGHTYLPMKNLLFESKRLLNIPEEIIKEAVSISAASKDIVIEGEEYSSTNVYLSSFYYAELGVARRLIEISLSGTEKNLYGIDEEINSYEKENNIEFADEQRQAITAGVKEGLCIITGGPGTGKTTIIKCMIRIFEKMGLTVVLGAPTGRAAKRITETTGREAKTIHRLLEMEFISSDDSPSFVRDEGNPIEADVIIIDEASMIDILLMNSLLKALAPGAKLILVGDVDQLPSVGPGNVLRDMIESKVITTVRLRHIYRQADESLITVNAHRINDGEMPFLNDRDKDFFFIQKNANHEIVDEILDLIKNRLPFFKDGFDPIKDMQILSPTRKGEIGIYNLNKRIQEILNPPSKDKAERDLKDFIFREGDKVMQIKNNYNLEWTKINGSGEASGTGVFNGDIGYIKEIDNENKRLLVVFDDDRQVYYDFINLDELELAYAITIHKSQGSEFKVVLIPISYGPPMLMTRNLIYTAVTRAKDLVVLVGLKQALYVMINNNTITERFSNLKQRIINFVSLI
ncbi:MAG TPA: ATP-dependent RecD-like DNA helicase, partial [Clostridiaceae bacterium]|nr:ATP-dependent RecD-like DNA helicase [Clostridiaceae bacterium]